MIYVKWGFWALVALLVVGFFHYTLPQHDIVRITDTYEKRVDPGINSLFWSSGAAGSDQSRPTRDVFFIQTFQADGDPMIYRNEDTGFWPPYLKFDTSNLQARAADLISKQDAEQPQWVSITHYGWRNRLLSIFPNAVDIEPVASPDVTIIPWFNIIFLIVLAALVWAVWVRWQRFRARRIDPVLDEWSEGFD